MPTNCLKPIQAAQDKPGFFCEGFYWIRDGGMKKLHLYMAIKPKFSSLFIVIFFVIAFLCFNYVVVQV